MRNLYRLSDGEPISLHIFDTAMTIKLLVSLYPCILVLDTLQNWCLILPEEGALTPLVDRINVGPFVGVNVDQIG